MNNEFYGIFLSDTHRFNVLRAYMAFVDTGLQMHEAFEHAWNESGAVYDLGDTWTNVDIAFQYMIGAINNSSDLIKWREANP